MKYLKLCLALALIFVFTISLALGQDMNPESEYCTTNPDDDSGLPECYTPDDNECYVGGEMENRCFTDYDWIVGWYLARYNDGIFEREDIPEAYRPPEPNLEDAVTVTGSDTCLQLTLFVYARKSSLAALGNTVSVVGMFGDPDCTQHNVNYALVLQSDSALADAVCNNYFPPNGTFNDFTSVYPNLYQCVA